MKYRNVWLGVTLLLLLAGGGYRLHVIRGAAAGSARGAPATDTAAAAICEHTLARAECPFCTPSLLESKGWCGGHGVPEALCTRCHRDLIPAFQAKGDWCAEHSLPESQCRTCNPDLPVLEPPKRAPDAASRADGAFCAEHGVAEAICFICSPGLIEANGMCAEHGVPEALCTRCDPALIPAFKATYDWCAEHDVPETQCVLCDPGLVEAGAAGAAPSQPTSPEDRRTAAPRAGCRTHAQRIVLASQEVVAQVGIETAKVLPAPFRDLIEVNAELAYPADRKAELSSRVDGLVAEVRARLGQWVTEGEVVVLVDSPELGAAKAELVATRDLVEVWERNHAREVELAGRGVGTQRSVIEADTRRAEARAGLKRAEQRLRALGLTDELVEEVRRTGLADSSLAVRAPFAGVVVALDTVAGEVVASGAPLLTIVDTRTMWALLAVPERVQARLAPGQPVVLTVQGLLGEQFTGRVTWVSTEIDDRTRTLAARAELRNDDGRLRANAFGRAQVTLSDRRDALLVPRDTVQWEGCCNVVFVPDGDHEFRPRKVRLGGATESHVEVLEGLDLDEEVVTVGAFLLKTELLKGSIGAGCCEGEE